MLLSHLLSSDSQIATLVDLVGQRSLLQPERVPFTFLANGENETGHLTYRALDRAARAIAAQLQQSVAAGDRAILLYPPGLEFIPAFLGCLYAKVIAIAAYLPQHPAAIAQLESIASSSQAAVILTTTPLLAPLTHQFSASAILRALPIHSTDEISPALADHWRPPSIELDAIAFLQYTSGSTGTPKGVMISHANLLHNLELIHQLSETNADTVAVSWVPHQHNMGLIACILQTIYVDFATVLMSPIAFLEKPERWFHAICHYRAKFSGGAAFAFDLCVQKIQPEQLQGVDLSCWEFACIGAEPILPSTLKRFTAKFSPYGFRHEAFYPSYGMTEATLLIAGGTKSQASAICTIDKAGLELNQAIPITEQSQSHPGSMAEFVAHGQTSLGQTIAIANPQTRMLCKSGEVGEIWVSGASVAQGYWQQAEQTQATFHAYLTDTGAGPFLRTGDLGFLQNGELFITGRLKELIIIRGRNYYPQDIELTIQSCHLALSFGGGAVFTVEKDHQTCLIVVQEVQATVLETLDPVEVIHAIRAAVSHTHQLSVYGVCLLKPGNLPRTANHKISRSACQRAFATNRLEMIAQDLRPVLPEESVEVNWAVLPQLTAEALLAIAPSQRQSCLETSIQAKLARRLRLDPGHLHPQQPLHQLGLDSLIMAEIKHQIETDLGINVPLVELLEGTTIRKLAAQIIHQLTGEPSIKTSPKCPFFCVHPFMGMASVYFDLATQIGRDRPFYGLQSTGITGEREPSDRIEAIAADYVQSIQRIQPEGPYCLGGWSFGALVALEMAHQLQKAGHPVQFLGIIDTPAPSPTSIQNLFQMTHFFFNSVLRHAAPYLGAGVDYFLAAAEERQLFQQTQATPVNQSRTAIASNHIVKVVARPERLLQLFQPEAKRLFQVMQANYDAMLNYTAKPYPGKVTLFRTHEQPEDYLADPTMGWEAIALGGVEQHRVPGNHLSVVTPPHVDVLALRLNVCLDQTQMEL